MFHCLGNVFCAIHFLSILFITTQCVDFWLILMLYANSVICCYSAIRWILFEFSIQWTLGKWKHWETFRLLSLGYFHESCRLFLLQKAFTKRVTFQGPLLPSAEYFQQRAQVPSQRDLGIKVLFGIRFSLKEVSGFPLMFRKANLSTAKPSL